ncbi:MAG: DUF4956 domain-containing protein [Anaerolineae bacterium]
MENIFGLTLYDSSNFMIMVSRFLLNIIVLLAVSWLYYKSTKKKQNLFIFGSFNIAIFFIIYLMSRSDIGIGFGFGLFAIFTILRYRTETIGLKTATYLFVFITIAVFNGMVSANISLVELVFVNVVLVVATWLIELFIRPKTKLVKKGSYKVVYDRLENIKPVNRAELLIDLKNRTGLEISNVKISDVDFSQNKAYLQVTYLDA